MIETLISRKASEVSGISQQGIFLCRVKGVGRGYKMIKFLFAGLLSANTIVDVAAVEFRLGSIILVEKLIFDVTCEKIGVARSHFGTHYDAVDLFVVVIGK